VNFPAVLCSLLLLAGCATLRDGAVAPKLDRLPAAESARRTPEAAPLALDDLLALTKSGATPQAIVARLQQSGTRFALTPAQVVDLHARGLPLPVLQAVYEDREKALQVDLTQQLVERDQRCRAEIDQARRAEQLRARLDVDPFCSGYGGRWGPFPYRRGW
jgi:hypothetical protein